jgi:hypothetical protein
MKTKNIINFALTGILLSPVIAINEVKASIDTKKVAVKNSRFAESQTAIFKPLYLERGNPKAPDAYWHRMAKCETRSNWEDGGKWSGGLGIYTRTWIRFGGLEFAKKPEFATVEQQIIIANRISTQGYQTKDSYLTWDDKVNKRPHFRKPVGFGGWGCMKYVGKPFLFSKPPYKIYFQKYDLGTRSVTISKLQMLIGHRRLHGVYDKDTRKVHREFVKKNRQKIIDDYNKYRW